jgi:hypothetical protein
MEENPFKLPKLALLERLPVRSNENKSCMRVDESWEELESCHESFLNSRVPVMQTRTRVAWELMRAEKPEFPWEFSQLSCPGQIKREQKLHESWWELRSQSLHESFLNSHALVKREQELHESWWELAGYYRARSETLINSSHQNLNQFKTDENMHESR